MPSEPDKKIEPLLGAYAARRRQAAESSSAMPGPMRNALQAEVRRRYPGPAQAAGSAPRRWLQTMAMLWPRIAAAGAITAALVATVWWSSPKPRQHEPQLASAPPPGEFRQDETRPEPVAVPAQTQPAPSVAADRYLATAQETAAPADKTVSLGSNLDPPPVPQPNSRGAARAEAKAIALSEAQPPMPATAPVEGRTERMTTTARLFATAPTPTPAPVATQPAVAPAPAPAPRSEPAPPPAALPAPQPILASAPSTPAAADSPIRAATPALFRNRSTVAQDSALRTRSASAAPSLTQLRGATPISGEAINGPGPVLDSFALEQQGTRLRLIDADGSIYEGLVHDSPTVATRSAFSTRTVTNRLQESARRTVNGPPPGPSRASSQISFEVSGTNRTLREPVRVAGTLFFEAITNAPPQSANEPARLSPSASRVQQTTFPGTQALGAGTLVNATSQVLRVQGRARLGATNELEIDATPELR